MHRAKKTMVAAAIALGAVAGGYSLLGSRGSDAKTLVGRVWIDHLPKNDAEHFELFVLVSDEPLGLFQRQSRYEGVYSMFRYELRGNDKAQLLFPQDASKHEVQYDARPCDVQDFDYCLDLSGAPRGAKKYFSRKEWVLDAGSPAALESALQAFVRRLPEP
jgi:hypothetical protein